MDDDVDEDVNDVDLQINMLLPQQPDLILEEIEDPFMLEEREQEWEIYSIVVVVVALELTLEYRQFET